MADDQEKTEEPTPKKIDDARKDGNVNKSIEVVGLIVLFFGSLYLLYFSSFTYTKIMQMMQYVYSLIGEPLTVPVLMSLAYTVLQALLLAILPILVIVFVMATIGNLAQFGFLFAPLKLKWEKIDPIKGFTNVFSMKKLVESLKLFLKIIVVFVVMFLLFYIHGDTLLSIMGEDYIGSVAVLVDITAYYIGAILLILLVFAVADFYFTSYHYKKSLKMSIKEVKDEFKNLEGDPHVKARIRQIQFQMSQKRMLSDVAESDVVITNPTHYAVALRYNKEKDNAPKVVAKGVDFLAFKIKEVALENDVPIIENPPLARAIYAQVEVDTTIPEEFYKAIAEVFIYIMNLKDKKV